MVDFCAVLCFHRHSRFVPLVLMGRPRPHCMGSAISRRAMSVQSDLTAPSSHRRRLKATTAPARLDFLTSSFVFIDIPGSAVEKVERRELRVEESGSQLARPRPQLRASCVVLFQPLHNPVLVYHCGHKLSSAFFANSEFSNPAKESAAIAPKCRLQWPFREATYEYPNKVTIASAAAPWMPCAGRTSSKLATDSKLAWAKAAASCRTPKVKTGAKHGTGGSATGTSRPTPGDARRWAA